MSKNPIPAIVGLIAMAGLLEALKEEKADAPSSADDKPCDCFACSLRRVLDEQRENQVEPEPEPEPEHSMALDFTPMVSTMLGMGPSSSPSAEQATAAGLMGLIEKSMLSAAEKVRYLNAVADAAKAVHAINHGAR